MAISVRWSQENGTHIAHINGRIDSSNSLEFDSELKANIKDEDRILLLDFSQVEFISSAGLRIVLSHAKVFDTPKVFAIFGLSELSKEIFQISGLDKIVNIHASKKDALGATRS